MNFNQHYKQRGLHAVFSPSQCSWLRYDDEKALSVYVNKQASERGSRLHAWAKETIDLGIKQPKSKKTLYMYVNDAIGYKMDTEVVLNNLDYDKIEQLISDDQRLEIDFNRDQFKKQLKADIEAYKNKR